MYQLLSPKIIVGLAAWAALSIYTAAGGLGMSPSFRFIVAAVDVGLLTVLFSNVVWRFIWNNTGALGVWLSKSIYPDLNGTYDVLLESNWPIVKRMLDAARHEADPFDPFDVNQRAPPLLPVNLEATIEQTWFDITMRMYPIEEGAVMKKSRTIATIPLKKSITTDQQLIYLFEQENDKRAPTDDEWHEGAARLTIQATKKLTLSGQYWNNRAWRRGVNAAGRITLVRKSPKIRRG
jgi:SMODS-associating 2TM, beta-strand rich effector domain